MREWNNGSEAEEAIQRHYGKDWDAVPDNYTCIERIADFCKSRDIQLILITTPCWKSYYENLDEKQLTHMYGLIRKLQASYGVSYFDYLKDLRFESDDFYDSNHLSDVGAIKFTKILNEDIKALN